MHGHQGARDAGVGEGAEQPLRRRGVGNQVAQQADQQDVAGAVEQGGLAAARRFQFVGDEGDGVPQRRLGVPQRNAARFGQFALEKRRHRAVEIDAEAEQAGEGVRRAGREPVRPVGTAEDDGRRGDVRFVYGRCLEGEAAGGDEVELKTGGSTAIGRTGEFGAGADGRSAGAADARGQAGEQGGEAVEVVGDRHGLVLNDLQCFVNQ